MALTQTSNLLRIGHPTQSSHRGQHRQTDRLHQWPLHHNLRAGSLPHPQQQKHRKATVEKSNRQPNPILQNIHLHTGEQSHRINWEPSPQTKPTHILSVQANQKELHNCAKVKTGACLQGYFQLFTRNDGTISFWWFYQCPTLTRGCSGWFSRGAEREKLGVVKVPSFVWMA